MSAASPAPAGAIADGAELTRLGITRVPGEHFLVGPYRYTNLADAVAEAKRGCARESET